MANENYGQFTAGGVPAGTDYVVGYTPPGVAGAERRWLVSDLLANGVTSLVAGTGIAVSSATGVVTISNTAAAGNLPDPTGLNYYVLGTNGSATPTWVLSLNDAAGVLSVDFPNRILYFNDGVTLAVDWQNCILADPSYGQSVDWNGRVLISTATNHTVNWDSCLLSDSADAPSLNWTIRGLIAPDGTTTSAQWDGSGAAAQTNFLLWDIDSGALQRVLVGPNNSGPGGAGRALYFANS